MNGRKYKRQNFDGIQPKTTYVIKISNIEEEPQRIKCPYCLHNSIIVFKDTRGHIQAKCKACGSETVYDICS